MMIVAFDPRRHDRGAFDSGASVLDDYLRRYASQNLRHHLARVYVAEHGQGRVLGYYTLSAGSVGHDELPETVARRLPAVLIGRLASDRRAREAGLRIGSRLLMHALRQALKAADTIGVQCVIVDSKPDSAGFYRRFGFLPLRGDGLKLFLPIGTIRALDEADA